jgi:sulfate adenylyltransferase subunit 2
MTCTAAVLSGATTLAAVISEIGTSSFTERGATRVDDRLTEAATEDRKRHRYF